MWQEVPLPSAIASAPLPRDLVLPADVARHLFSFVPLRPRLWAVSLVCKRWRTFVLQTDTSLVLPSSPIEAIPLFSSLLKLHLTSIPSGVTFATPSLQTLVVAPDVSDAVAPFTQLTSLTALHIGGSCRLHPPWISVFRSLAASLKSIAFSLEYGRRDVDSQLASLELPCLSSLEICGVWQPCIAALLTRHCSQLKSLTLRLYAPDAGRCWDELASHFPSFGTRLTDLEIDVGDEVIARETLLDILAKCPPSVRLSVPVRMGEPEWLEAFTGPNAITDTLFDLKINAVPDVANFIRVLSVCTRLCTLSLRHVRWEWLTKFDAALPRTLAARVVSIDLSISAVSAPLALLASFPRLQNVQADLIDLQRAQHLLLPSVTRLCVFLGDALFTDTTAVLANFPSLRQLVLQGRMSNDNVACLPDFFTSVGALRLRHLDFVSLPSNDRVTCDTFRGVILPPHVRELINSNPWCLYN